MLHARARLALKHTSVFCIADFAIAVPFSALITACLVLQPGLNTQQQQTSPTITSTHACWGSGL